MQNLNISVSWIWPPCLVNSDRLHMDRPRSLGGVFEATDSAYGATALQRQTSTNQSIHASSQFITTKQQGKGPTAFRDCSGTPSKQPKGHCCL